jgi:hypothetical protein
LFTIVVLEYIWYDCTLESFWLQSGVPLTPGVPSMPECGAWQYMQALPRFPVIGDPLAGAMLCEPSTSAEICADAIPALPSKTIAAAMSLDFNAGLLRQIYLIQNSGKLELAG